MMHGGDRRRRRQMDEEEEEERGGLWGMKKTTTSFQSLAIERDLLVVRDHPTKRDRSIDQREITLTHHCLIACLID
jgi:hypothetical protein